MLSLTSATLPQAMTMYPFLGGWVSTMASPEGCRKSHPSWDSKPRVSSQYRVAIPTTLFRSTNFLPLFGIESRFFEPAA